MEFGDCVITSAGRKKTTSLLCFSFLREALPAVTSREAATPQTICQSNKHNSDFHGGVYGRFKPPINKAGAGTGAAASTNELSVDAC